MSSEARSADLIWYATVEDILRVGRPLSPRGIKTLDTPHRRVVLNARVPVVTHPRRKLSYRFMAAEAFWILSGDDRVETIAPWNPKIADFSDDGQTFYGAYGPRIKAQIQEMVRKLVDDQHTRQAGMTIWRENPPPTKDVPCTVAIFADRRAELVNLHVFMRSSDAWLGLPYDMFNFSMLLHLICCRLNAGGCVVEPGAVYLTMASSHLYERNLDDARACLEGWNVFPRTVTPPPLFRDEDVLMNALKDLRDSSVGSRSRWWR